jgi:hypothetical protein
MADDRAQARREAAVLLGVDIDRLSPADSLRVDMISSLRLVIDHEQGNVLSGNSADLGKLNIAVASLIALLPGKALPEPAPVEGGPSDPRTIMVETYMAMRKRGEFADALSTRDGCLAEIEKLRAEIAALKAGGVPAPDEPGASADASGDTANASKGSAAAVEHTSDNVVPLSRLPSDGSKVRSGPLKDPPQPAPPQPAAAASTPRAVAPAPSFDYDEAMRYVRPDGSISPTPVGGRWDA